LVENVICSFFYRFFVRIIKADRSFGVNNYEEVEQFVSTENALSYASIVFGVSYQTNQVSSAAKLLRVLCPWIEITFADGISALRSVAKYGKVEAVKVLLEGSPKYGRETLSVES